MFNVGKQILEDKEISTLKEMIEFETTKPKLKEEEIKTIKDLIKTRGEVIEVEKPSEVKEEIQVQPKIKRKVRKVQKPVIEDVKIAKITDLWRKKPKFLNLESHVIIVKIKIPDGKEVKETFYVYIKPDGRFDIKSDRTKTAIQRKFVNFVQQYNLTDSLERQNVMEAVKGWKGKTVTLDDFGNVKI